MASSSSESISLCKILSESRSIIREHPHHFRVLTILFLFPLSLCSIIYVTIQPTFSPHTQSNSTYTTYNPILYLLFTLLYTISVTLFSLCAVASISYSTYRAIYKEPLNLVESIKSIYNSFWPMVSTIIVLELIFASIFIPFMVLVLLVYKRFYLSGVENISSLSSYFLIVIILISLVFIALLIYFQVNWILAYVVVVVESKWGYEPLQRSVSLIKGNRGVALSIMMYFGLISGAFFWCLYGTGWSRWAFFLYAILASICQSFILLGNCVATVVLYVHCRDLHEGLPIKNAKNCPLLK